MSVRLLERREDNSASPEEQGPLYEKSNRGRVRSLSPLWPAAFSGSFLGHRGLQKIGCWGGTRQPMGPAAAGRTRILTPTPALKVAKDNRGQGRTAARWAPP